MKISRAVLRLVWPYFLDRDVDDDFGRPHGLSSKIHNEKLIFLNVFKFNWITGSPPKFDTLLASWYPTYMQSFIISHSSWNEAFECIVCSKKLIRDLR